MFAATAATIVSGAVAERTKFGAYIIFSIIITGFIYPIFGSWVWGGGWLNDVGDGFVDFAGSTVVHSVGGWAALAGAIVVGPRLGKFTAAGKPIAIPGHSITLAALGVFLLWFGWFGFNAGSTLSGNDLTIATIAVTTNLAAAAGVIGAMSISYVLFKRFDVSMAINGAIAGLVAITAGTANVGPMMAIIIGLIGGIIVVFPVLALERIFKIDDPVSAISVHGTTGLWGLLAVGIFANGNNGVSGLVAGNALQIVSQLISMGVVLVWALGTGFALFLALKYGMGVRVTEEEELEGLDMPEHGLQAYPIDAQVSGTGGSG